MVKTSYSIYLDYQKAIRQAERLEQAAKELQKEIARMDDCYSSIQASWKSNSANAYLAKLRKVRQEIDSVENNLTESAAAVRKIAKNTYEAEKRALLIAETRSAW